MYSELVVGVSDLVVSEVVIQAELQLAKGLLLFLLLAFLSLLQKQRLEKLDINLLNMMQLTAPLVSDLSGGFFST